MTSNRLGHRQPRTPGITGNTDLSAYTQQQEINQIYTPNILPPPAPGLHTLTLRQLVVAFLQWIGLLAGTSKLIF